MHGVAGAVNGAVGVDVADGIAIGIARKIPTGEGIDGEIVATPGQDQRGFRIGVFDRDVYQARGIGVRAGDLQLIRPED